MMQCSDTPVLDALHKRLPMRAGAGGAGPARRGAAGRPQAALRAGASSAWQAGCLLQDSTCRAMCGALVAWASSHALGASLAVHMTTFYLHMTASGAPAVLYNNPLHMSNFSLHKTIRAN